LCLFSWARVRGQLGRGWRLRLLFIWSISPRLSKAIAPAILVRSIRSRAARLHLLRPRARRSAALMTAAVTSIFVGEKLSALGWAGIAALVGGVLLLSARGARHLAEIDRRAVGFALFTALTICAYSVVDGIGARLSANPNGYSVWLFVGIAVVMVPYALYRDGRDVIPAMQRFWLRGFAGGALQVLSYGIAIWAMTVAPIAIVATLRETSVLFGAVIAVRALKEPLRSA